MFRLLDSGSKALNTSIPTFCHYSHAQLSQKIAPSRQVSCGAASFVTNASSSQAPQVAIVGGGISGLMCARILQQNGHRAIVFERDASRDSRTQGGLLDMHVESGQWALQQAGLFDHFQALIHEGTQDIRVMDHRGTVHWEEEGPPGTEGRPEIDRPALRAMLLDALQPETIKWGHHLVAIEPRPPHGHTLRFADGASMTADVVVGADGARSRVRPLVTNVSPSYCGACYFDMRIPDADRMHPEVTSVVGRGSFMALGDSKGIMAQRLGDGSIYAWAACRMSEDRFTQLQLDKAWESAAASKQAVGAMFEGWPPECLRLIHACDHTMKSRSFAALPVGLTWQSRSDVTLLGDSAHLSSPFAGEGANLALQDGADFALELLKAADPAEAIAAYEARMFSRAEAAAVESAQGLEMCLAPDGAERLAQFMRSAHEL
ncbi:hypothetical protein WJX84_008772 [Apatococcus fuscideae]|uniref:FAD-binding domain-containing protein n=1 Tax=Apatococcus fuscideae TaxID=2026836 RepID=A0AAW1TCU0_9CHLO